MHKIMRAGLLCLLFAGPAIADSTSTVAGTAEYLGTPVQTNPNGVPTLVYNCAKLPAICKNVNNRNPINGGGDSSPGTLILPAGVDHIELNSDPDESRHSTRNGQACPSRWKISHACPEPGQPRTVPKGASVGFGSFIGQKFNNVPQGGDGSNMIADRFGNYRGMIWTCDEWPPAITLEGGTGAGTYCVPQNQGCSQIARRMANGVAGVDSEQNFQSRAHNRVKRQSRLNASGKARIGVFTFHFRTTWVDNGAAFATRVVYYTADANNVADNSNYQKRGLVSGEVVTYDYFDNGTESMSSRPFTELEAQHATINRRQAEFSGAVANFSLMPPMKQKFEELPQAPLLDVLEIRNGFVLAQLASLISSVNDTLNDLPGIIGNVTDGIGNITDSVGDAVSGILSGVGGILPPTSPSIMGAPSPTQTTEFSTSPLSASAETLTGFDFRQPTDPLVPMRLKRQAVEQCGPGSPCPDGSCCNLDGNCGFGPENCGAGNCTNNCNAKANCGKDSEGGSVSCPLNVCCSAFGYCGVGPEFCDSPLPEFPCQEGFGSCSTISPPSCGGGSARQRSIGYWQSYNVRTRQCNRIRPADINTDGLTHLYLAFATIDPISFQVKPAHPEDPQLYEEFVALKRSGLETWLAVGGWDFSDPGPTRTTWSDMAMTASGRSSFINSCIAIMDQYGFQGIDIDWEYPVAPDRDGRPEDMENFVSLVREMRAAFGSRGISVAIAASYWYLRGFDPKAMEPYVDFLGVMTYDLHGPWDKSVKHIGPVVAGQTNVPEIYNWTLPLWYAGLDPAKLNFGLAYYGRGYTLSDRSCNYVGCTWSDASRPYACTNFPGVASLTEIENSIQELGLTARLLQDDMMKVLTAGDQWMGYDDLETIELKKDFASSLCFGGTMIWSVDLYSGSGSGNTPDGQGSDTPGSPAGGSGQGGAVGEDDGDDIVLIDPSIWNDANPEINCEPPCSFVLPPLQLLEPTTILIPPITTSLEVAYPRTTVLTVDGSESTTTFFRRSTITTTIVVPAVTTTEIEVWGRTIGDRDTNSEVSSSFFVTSSILPPVVIVTNDPDPEYTGTTSEPPVTRTIRPPPFPYTRPSRSDFLPIITYRPGPPRPRCRPPSICGTPCRIFCDAPCPPGLCADGDLDFPDPRPPPPPPGTSPQPPGGSEVDPEGREDGDEEEDDEERCEFEFGLPPGGDDSDRRDPPYITPRVTSTSNPTIAPPKPIPTPSPPPNPAPPRPRRDTETRRCYDSGVLTGRGDAIRAVENFCEYAAGRTLDDSTLERKSIEGIDSAVAGFVSIVQSITVRNGCKFDVDRQECRRIMRRILDECDTTSTRFKQGGTVEDNCATWRLDPNTDIENLLCSIPVYRLGDYVLNGGEDCS